MLLWSNLISGPVRPCAQTDLNGTSSRETCALSSVKPYDVDLLAGGIPCPPFSKAGRQLGEQDERDLFPEVLRLVEECRP